VRFEKDLIVGLLALIIAITAIASPFIMYVGGWLSGGAVGNAPSADLGSVLSTIVGALTRFGFTGWGEELVKEDTLNTSSPFSIVAIISGGGIEVVEGGENGVVRVKVYRSTRFPQATIGSYEYGLMDGKLMVRVEDGYVVKLYVPSNYVESINVTVSGGGLRIQLSDANALRVLNARVDGGGARLDLGSLSNTSITVLVSGGGLDADLAYADVPGRVYSNVTVSVEGGGAKLHISAPGYAFRAGCSASGGALNLRVNGESRATINGESTYVDPNYGEALRRISVSVRVSGGGADVWLTG